MSLEAQKRLFEIQRRRLEIAAIQRQLGRELSELADEEDAQHVADVDQKIGACSKQIEFAEKTAELLPKPE
jgi:hypothetical protein